MRKATCEATLGRLRDKFIYLRVAWLKALRSFCQQSHSQNDGWIYKHKGERITCGKYAGRLNVFKMAGVRFRSTPSARSARPSHVAANYRNESNNYLLQRSNIHMDRDADLTPLACCVNSHFPPFHHVANVSNLHRKRGIPGKSPRRHTSELPDFQSRSFWRLLARSRRDGKWSNILSCPHR